MSLRNQIIGVCLLAGCASSQSATLKTDPPASSLRRDVSLELRTATKDGPGWQVVPPGATLPSRTEFAVSVAVSQPAFLYVGQRSAGAELTLLYPAPSTAATATKADAGLRAEPNQPAQLPDAGQWFRLDDHEGEESLFVLLSAQPQVPAKAQQLLAERGDAACVKTRDPPPPEVKSRDRGSAVHGLLGDDGLAVLCFPFHHR